MTAFGRQTAAPRAKAQAATVTDSAMQATLEASPVSPITFVFRQIAPSSAFRAQFEKLRASVHFSFPPTLLSAPSVSAA
jgi:hypothetical protein